jgi:hypothetical protein
MTLVSDLHGIVHGLADHQANTTPGLAVIVNQIVDIFMPMYSVAGFVYIISR